jgi:predicted nucleic acid-binding protein
MLMSDRYLVDTNILVYAYDRAEPVKMEKAQQLLQWLEWNAVGVLSTQVLGEFFWIVSRKLATPLPLKECALRLESFLRSWPILLITPLVLLEAARGTTEYQLPFWDAQLWATAKLNGVFKVLSEDFSHQSWIESVQFINPFRLSIWERAPGPSH